MNASTETTDSATFAAASQLAAVDPVWSLTGRADDLIGLSRNELLHAGPPFATVTDLPPPLLNAACAALLFEGRADNREEAQDLIRSGTVRLLPAQDRQVVTPLAAVVSASMWLHQVTDARASQRCAYAPINEGSGPAQRAGLFGPEVVARLQFVHRTVGPALASAVGDVDLMALAVGGLAQGDDLHARVGQPSAALAQRLIPSNLPADVMEFLRGNPHAFLNLWMAACRCMLMAAAETGTGQLLVAAGGNGKDFGIQLSGAPGVWRQAPAGPPLGPPLSESLADYRRLPAIGDSAVIDAVGFGALALDAAPAFSSLLDSSVVADMEHVRLNYLVTTHPALGRKVGLDSSRVTADMLPGVCLAALDHSGKQGLVGRGIARHPADLYPQPLP